MVKEKDWCQIATLSSDGEFILGTDVLATSVQHDTDGKGRDAGRSAGSVKLTSVIVDCANLFEKL